MSKAAGSATAAATRNGAAQGKPAPASFDARAGAAAQFNRAGLAAEGSASHSSLAVKRNAVPELAVTTQFRLSLPTLPAPWITAGWP